MKNVMDMATITATGVVGNGIDASIFAGVIAIAAKAFFVGGTTPAAVIKVQSSATSGGTFTDVAVFTASDGTMSVDSRNCKKYIAVHATLSGTPDSATVAFSIAGKVSEV